MVQTDFTIVDNTQIGVGYGLIKLQSKHDLRGVCPGQFVQVLVPDAPNTFLRRPISVCNVEGSTLWLLVRAAGDGTRRLLSLAVGSVVNIILPLGNGFRMDFDASQFRPLLVGGGVGVAPLLYYGKCLKERGITPDFLLAAKTESQLLLTDLFSEIGNVYIATDDGSVGEKGLVTSHSVLQSGKFNYIACCGPMPMMKAIAKIANKINVDCEVSLENVMGCGIGACLCCVEDTVDHGNVCVCKEGPVFNINRLKW